MIRMERVLRRQQLDSSASKVRPVFGRVRSASLRGPAVRTPGDDRLRTLQRLLESGYGCTTSEGGRIRRRAPSAGGLYPTEVVCVVALEGHWTALAYDFHRRLFRELARIDRDIVTAVCAARDDQAIVVVTSTLWRTLQRYGFRGYRYCLLDAGIVMGTLAQVCGAERRTVSYPDNWSLAQIHESLALPDSEIVACAAVVDCATAAAGDVEQHPDIVTGPAVWQQSPMLAAELERTIRLDRAMRVAESPHDCLVPVAAAAEVPADLQDLLARRRSARGLRRGQLDYERCAPLFRAIGAALTDWPQRLRDSIVVGVAVRDERARTAAVRRAVPEPVRVAGIGHLSDSAVADLFGGQALMADADLFLIAGMRSDSAEDAVAMFRTCLLQIGLLTATLQLLAVRAEVGHTVVGGFDDERLSTVFGHTITPLMAIALGTANQLTTKNDTLRRTS
ncbi:hypothetical protein IRT45_27340 [Nocardia sp. BSTN01]|uniref:hypothetical protein n=1 Tax=Nocardia sp. BSTN01 TaxID=2783665 RepID=UPI00188F25F9|nr:hypothetical protein [Nocardia sp. BSTN01]MBF5000858.1 hypothetical protein [Nocardia sp. BSTN01]